MSFTTRIKEVDKCGLCDIENAKPEIRLAAEVYYKVIALNSVMGNDEWLGYLVGTKDEEGNYDITGLAIPKQEVSGAAAEDTHPEESLKIKGLVGTIHSHHTMGAFFSGTDTDFVAANQDVTVVVSSKGWKQKVKYQLPCGHYALVDASLKILFPVAKYAPFAEEAKKNISKKVYTPPVYQYPYSCYGQQQGSLVTRDPKRERKNYIYLPCDHCHSYTKESELELTAEGMEICPTCFMAYSQGCAD